MPGFGFNLQAIGFSVVICEFEMRHQWNIPSKLIDLLDDRLNSWNLGYIGRSMWRCHISNNQLHPGVQSMLVGVLRHLGSSAAHCYLELKHVQGCEGSVGVLRRRRRSF